MDGVVTGHVESVAQKHTREHQREQLGLQLDWQSGQDCAGEMEKCGSGSGRRRLRGSSSTSRIS